MRRYAVPILAAAAAVLALSLLASFLFFAFALTRPAGGAASFAAPAPSSVGPGPGGVAPGDMAPKIDDMKKEPIPDFPRRPDRKPLPDGTLPDAP